MLMTSGVQQVEFGDNDAPWAEAGDRSIKLGSLCSCGSTEPTAGMNAGVGVVALAASAGEQGGCTSNAPRPVLLADVSRMSGETGRLSCCSMEPTRLCCCKICCCPLLCRWLSGEMWRTFVVGSGECEDSRTF